VPVFVSHSAAVFAEFERPIGPAEFSDLLRASPGVVVQDEPKSSVYPQPWEATGKDDVFVGRIRRDLSCENGIAFWTVSDNLRKGAALNAVQIAETLIERNLI